MMKKRKQKIFSGDSLIEVLLGITVFSAVSVGGSAIMNSGLNQAQRSLEITMARNEIDAQAEALRFIHNNYIAEREFSEDKWQFTDLWNKIVDSTIDPDDIMGIDTTPVGRTIAASKVAKGMIIVSEMYVPEGALGCPTAIRPRTINLNTIKDVVVL